MASTKPAYHSYDATFAASGSQMYLTIGRTSHPLTIIIGHDATIAAIVNNNTTRPLDGLVLDERPDESIPETPPPQSDRHQPHDSHVEPTCIHQWDHSTRKPITYDDWMDEDGDRHLTTPREVIIGYSEECLKCGWKRERYPTD